MVNKLLISTERLIKWLSFSESVSKARLISRYALVLAGQYFFFFGLYTLFNPSSSVGFTFVCLCIALFAHIAFKEMLNQGLKEKMGAKAIEQKFVKITAIGLGVAFSIGFTSTILGIILHNSALTNGFAFAALLNFILGLFLTCINLPKEYLQSLAAHSTFDDESSKKYESDKSPYYYDPTNPANPNYYKRD